MILSRFAPKDYLIFPVPEFHKRPPYALTCSRTVIQWTEKLLNFKDTTSDMLDERYETLLRLASLNAEHYVDVRLHTSLKTQEETSKC